MRIWRCWVGCCEEEGGIRGMGLSGGGSLIMAARLQRGQTDEFGLRAMGSHCPGLRIIVLVSGSIKSLLTRF